MRFRLIDAVLEVSPERAVAVKHVAAAEEYLADHFAGFPILPGVFMLEALVQAAREVAERRDADSGSGGGPPWVLGSARAVKYGRFVPPGCGLRLAVEVVGATAEAVEFKGVGVVVEPSGVEGGTAVSGKFSLRRVRVG